MTGSPVLSRLIVLVAFLSHGMKQEGAGSALWIKGEEESRGPTLPSKKRKGRDNGNKKGAAGTHSREDLTNGG